MDVYFKLFNNIKADHEIELARLEIESLAENPREVRNFVDEFREGVLAQFFNAQTYSLCGTTADHLRLQDLVTHELPYGSLHGFALSGVSASAVNKLVARLAYTKELFVIGSAQSPEAFAKRVFPRGRSGENLLAFAGNGKHLLRLITDQFYLEKSYYISKTTRNLNTERIDDFVEVMFGSLTKHLARIPAGNGARVGKRLLDHIADRREPSLYLFHGLHPYKGKFHPKMTRALINIVHPMENGRIVDHFAGSGTLLLEASMMGFDSMGIEINPMSVLMSNAKCSLLTTSFGEIKRSITKFLEEFSSIKPRLRIALLEPEEKKDGILPSTDDIDKIMEIAPTSLSKIGRERVEQLHLAERLASSIFKGRMKNIIRFGVAMAVSTLRNGSKKSVDVCLKDAFHEIARRTYLFEKIKERLQLTPGKGKAYKGSCELNPAALKRKGAQSNVNSPPYSTALDYIRNDLNQLLVLDLVSSKNELDELESTMGGNPKSKVDQTVLNQILENNDEFLPKYAMRIIQVLHESRRKSLAYRFGRFFLLLRNSLLEQSKVIENGGRMATIIGVNLLKISDDASEIADGIRTPWGTVPVEISKLEGNLPGVDGILYRDSEIDKHLDDEGQVRIWDVPKRRGVLGGAYVEIQNERVLHELSKLAGFKPEVCLYRELQKSLRGHIRYEAIYVSKRC